MTTQKELLEGEVHTVNEQLYASYKHIAELNARITKLEEEIKSGCEFWNLCPINATLTPFPVYPNSHAPGAWISCPGKYAFSRCH